MGIRKKVIAVISAVLLCVSAFAVTANAEDDYGYDGEVSETEAPYYEPETEAPYYEPETEEPYYEPETEAPYYEPETEAPYYEPETESYDWNDEDDEPLYYSQDEEVYVGGGQSGYTVPDSTAPSAALYDVNTIDGKELSDSDWNDISANLSKAAASDSDGDGDFGFIKNNNSTTDNGDWVLYLGIALIVLSVAGIAYVVVSIVMNRRKVAVYAGGHRSSSEKASSGRAKSKFDTADVKLPKKTSGSGGRRYK